MRLIAFVTDSGSITRILAYLGEPISRTDRAKPLSEFEFDGRVGRLL